MVVVPEQFARDTIAREGENGRLWIKQLPQLVSSLCQHWGLIVDGAPQHGYLGLVVPVNQGERACVLKVSWPNEETAVEAAALQLWQGQGAVQLLNQDVASGAILLERLQSDQSLQKLPVAKAFTVAGKLLRRLAVPVSGNFPCLRIVAPEMADSFLVALAKIRPSLSTLDH